MVLSKEKGFGQAGVLEGLAVLVPGGKYSKGDPSVFDLLLCLPPLTRVKPSSSIDVK